MRLDIPFVKKEYDVLLRQAKDYLKRIEELTHVPVKLISLEPERQDTIVID